MAMGLKWATCTVCGQNKPLQKSGAMCIHVDADSVRCPGSGVLTAPLPIATVQPSTRPRYKANEITPPEKVKSEIEAAFETVKRHGRLLADPQPSGPLDRRIYAVKGAHIVGGGLPTLGRRR